MTSPSPAEPGDPRYIVERYPFVGRLFDLSFSKFITPTIARLLYVLALVMIGVEFVLALVWFIIIVGGVWVVLYLPVAAVGSFMGVLAARISVEWTMAFFSMVRNLQQLVDRGPPAAEAP